MFTSGRCCCRPVITTDEDGSLRFTSEANLVFEAGDGGSVQFMTTTGALDLKGEKVSHLQGRAWLCIYIYL